MYLLRRKFGVYLVDNTAMNLKNQLKLYIAEKDISLSRLARQSGVSRQTLNDWLLGKPATNINKIKKIADILDVSVDHLAFGSGLENVKDIHKYQEEINCGVFEVVLRKIKR